MRKERNICSRGRRGEIIKASPSKLTSINFNHIVEQVIFPNTDLLRWSPAQIVHQYAPLSWIVWFWRPCLLVWLEYLVSLYLSTLSSVLLRSLSQRWVSSQHWESLQILIFMMLSLKATEKYGILSYTSNLASYLHFASSLIRLSLSQSLRTNRTHWFFLFVISTKSNPCQNLNLPSMRVSTTGWKGNIQQ